MKYVPFFPSRSVKKKFSPKRSVFDGEKGAKKFQTQTEGSGSYQTYLGYINDHFSTLGCAHGSKAPWTAPFLFFIMMTAPGQRNRAFYAKKMISVLMFCSVGPIWVAVW